MVSLVTCHVWDAVDKQIARTAAGKKESATNIVTKTDNDHLTWQVTKLTMDGQSLPDLKPVAHNFSPRRQGRGGVCLRKPRLTALSFQPGR
jgi:hypothetical protein